MPLHLKCPLCGKAAVVPDAAIHRRVECGFCHAQHAVRDIVEQSDPPAGQDASAGEGMARGDKLLLAWCCGVPAALLLVFLVYWFGFRDTWELDNYLRIVQQCDAVELAITQSDDAAAAEAYAELNTLIGPRTVKHRNLAARLADTRTAFAPVNARLEEAEREREAQEFAERRRREALAEANVRSQRARERTTLPHGSEVTYKGFSESELERLYEQMRRDGHSPEEAILTVKAMLDYPDTRAVAREWLRRTR